MKQAQLKKVFKWFILVIIEISLNSTLKNYSNKFFVILAQLNLRTSSNLISQNIPITAYSFNNETDDVRELDKINLLHANWKRVACTFRAEEIIRNNTFHWHFQRNGTNLNDILFSWQSLNTRESIQHERNNNKCHGKTHRLGKRSVHYSFSNDSYLDLRE